MGGSKVRRSVNVAKVGGIILIILGAVIAGFWTLGVIGFCFSLKDPNAPGYIVTSLIGALIGLAILVAGVQNQKLAKDFDRFSAWLAADPVKSVERLAAAMGIAPPAAKKRLKRMIGRGFFPGMYIDEQRGCAVFPSQAQTALPQTAFVTVACSGCGATNKIVKGTVGECEFCGSQISAK